MRDRLTRPALWVILPCLPVAAACATHAPAASPGDLHPAVATAPTKSGVIPANAGLLPAGMMLPVRLDRPLSTAGPVGLSFSATVPADMLASDGAVAVPAGSVVRGVVTAIHAGTKTDPSLIRLDVDLLEMKGRSFEIRAAIAGVTPGAPAAGAASSTAPGLGTIVSREAADRVLGRDSTTVLPETTISLGSGEPGSAALPAGSVLTIRLDTAIAVGR